MSVDRWRHPALLLFVLATVQLVGLALFCKGFFPYKVYLPGFSGVDSLPPWPDGTTASPFAEAVFDRLALVVVDALRNDFVLGRDSGFDFVRSLIERGEALPFTARATAPTVTMPRIKAMTTGTIPSFLDAILNIAESDTSSSLLHHDNWVHQFRQRGNRTIHFYGDDTWIRLFPDAFTKMDGTTSFYVSDTVQVDLNVTRHIRSAFSEQNWDAIILHYLGLDHVGHLGGPYSPLMRPKQQEMDQAIELIYEIVAQQDAERIVRDPNAKGTLIVLCGDHGMNEVGNHGGSSVGETSAALVFLSPRFASRPILIRQSTTQFDEDRPIVLGYPIIDQVDLVPTLASLFGFPIPKNNLGKIIPDIFRKLSQDPKPLLRALQVNAYQLGLLLAEIDPTISTYLHDPFSFDSKKQDTNNPAYWYVQAVLLHKNAMKADSHVDQEAFAYYTKFINFAQSRLAKTASNYDLRLMVIGTSFIIGSTVFFIAWSKATTQGARGSTVWNFSKTFSVLGISAYCISMFASSFVEEEHTIWYYYVQTLCLLAAIQSMRLCELPIRERYWLVLMQIAQMILFRVSVVVHYYPDMWEKSIWHLVALSLVTPVLLVSARLVRRTGNVGTNNNSEVSSSANYIRLLCKGASILLVCLTSCLVMIYKIRDATTPAPSIYTDALASLYEFTSQLDQVQLGRLIYNYGGSCIFVACALAYVDRRASDLQLQEQTNRAGKYLDLILYMSTPILILLTRSHNAVLFVIYCIQFELMRAWNRALSARGKERQLLQLPPWLVATQMLCMIQAAFYATGHSNSIAAVDLSNAYIGVSSYDPMTIGLLTFLSNWSAPLWWGTAGWILVADMADAASWWNYLVSLSAVFGSALSALSVSVTVLREHLFIWTVFSPKYLYQMAWTTLFHWFSQALLGTIFIKLLAA